MVILSYRSILRAPVANISFANPPPARPTQPVARIERTNTVAVLHDGDIELNTGNGTNPRIVLKADRVESHGDVFLGGMSEGVAAQLTSLTARLEEEAARVAEVRHGHIDPHVIQPSSPYIHTLMIHMNNR